MSNSTVHVVKIGGSIANSPERRDDFIQHFSTLSGPRVLVHGGGNAASELCRKLDIPITMTDGRRITDAPALDVAVMVYAGLLNKTIVANLQATGCNAIGLSGADANTIPAHQRAHPTIDFGLVGDIDASALNIPFIGRLLDDGIVPVFCAITHDGSGQLLNTNADTIAATLATTLTNQYDVSLTYCLDKPGVLRDVTDDKSLLPTLSHTRYDALKAEGAIHEGMIPKLDTAFGALAHGVHSVWIKRAANLTTSTGTRLNR